VSESLLLNAERRALPGGALARIRRSLTLLGPALLVSVGYTDPGNWATDLEGGAKFGYGLVWVLLASSTMAIVLQTLSARLGIVSGMNLAQGCRQVYSPRVNAFLWILAEIAIVACDAAEVVGSAIALNMLFGLPLVLGAILTALDVLVVLALQHRRLAVLQACIAGLLLVIALCLAGEMWLVRPSPKALLHGLTPRLPEGALYTAVGILGATLMPHNLYLQSALVKRAAAPNARRSLRQSWISTAIALNIALLLNIAILLLSAEAFSSRGLVVTDLRDAQRLLSPLLGSSLASVLFATGLLCSGQSATVTGTLAGQIVMEGFLQTRLSPALRRLLTRCAAVVPAVVVLVTVGSSGMMPLLIGSQVVLSLQLPFAIVPLLRLTSCRRLMGPELSGRGMRIASAGCALVVCVANALLLYRTCLDLSALSAVVAGSFAVLCLAGAGFLLWVLLVPLRVAGSSETEPERRRLLSAA
jgi:manganese transport protein